jgi:hypothetical protein
MIRFVVDSSAVSTWPSSKSRSLARTSCSRRRSFALKRCRPARGRPARGDPYPRRAQPSHPRRPPRNEDQSPGDAVLRRRVWDLAEQLGWASTNDAEYLALTQVQADAFVTRHEELARSVEGIVATASIDAFR